MVNPACVASFSFLVISSLDVCFVIKFQFAYCVLCIYYQPIVNCRPFLFFTYPTSFLWGEEERGGGAR